MNFFVHNPSRNHPQLPRARGGGGTWIPNQGLEGGVRLKAEKKIVTLVSMAEVVVDVPEGTSDGPAGDQDFKMCLSCRKYFHGCEIRVRESQRPQ